MTFRVNTANNRKFNMFFLKPKRSLDAFDIARRLSSKRGIKEVLVTEGSYGFVVKANEDFDEDIFTRISDDFAKVTCHYQYRNLNVKTKGLDA